MQSKHYYSCDKCSNIHILNENVVKDKQFYVSPFSCYGGDYWLHKYFYFTCDCGRDIKVKEEHLKQGRTIEKITKNIEECA